MEGNVNLNPNNFDNNYVDMSFLDDKVKKSSFYGKVFLYFGLGILVTSIITLGLSWLFSTLEYASVVMFYGVFLVVSLIAMIIINFQIVTRLTKANGKSILVPYIAYAVIYGVLFGCIAGLIQDPLVIGVSLGITALIFLGMCGIGYLTHNKMNIFLKITSVLTMAILLLCIVNLVIFPFALFGGNYELYFAQAGIYWLMEGIFFIVFLLYTIIDFARIRQIAEAGAHKGATNLTIYCAFTIYADFIAIFTYVLKFVLIALASRDN